MSIIKHSKAVQVLGESCLREDFKDCYEKYYKAVFKHTSYLTGNAHIAEDIVQETFVRLYNTPPAHTNTYAWLIKVSTNLVYNYLRDEKSRKSKEPSISDDESDKVISIEDAAIRNYEIRTIRKSLNFLPVRDRLCLMLKFSGYKYNEIADIIDVDKSSVGTILARAQAKFKEKYIKEV